MYTQFFGNFLINKGVVTSEQLLAALEAQSASHAKFGALAVHAGYMTASEVERVYILQTHQDKRFGEIAVEEGYLTQDQVEDLLGQQIPDYILLGQILVEQNVLAAAQLEELMADYQSEYELYDLDIAADQKEMVIHLLQSFRHAEGYKNVNYVMQYLTLFFHNLIRFIGDDFTPLTILELPEVPVDFCTSQLMECPDFQVQSALDMEPQTAIAFASRYIGEPLNEFDEYVKASLEDFLNLHNGLFTVNMSNDYSLEVQLEPPSAYEETLFSPGKTSYLLPVMFPFGTIHFIWSPIFEN